MASPSSPVQTCGSPQRTLGKFVPFRRERACVSNPCTSVVASSESTAEALTRSAEPRSTAFAPDEQSDTRRPEPTVSGAHQTFQPAIGITEAQKPVVHHSEFERLREAIESLELRVESQTALLQTLHRQHVQYQERMNERPLEIERSMQEEQVTQRRSAWKDSGALQSFSNRLEQAPDVMEDETTPTVLYWLERNLGVDELRGRMDGIDDGIEEVKERLTCVGGILEDLRAGGARDEDSDDSSVCFVSARKRRSVSAAHGEFAAKRPVVLKLRRTGEVD